MIMSTPNLAIDILLAHDRWATNRLLESCRTLDDAALDRPFEMGRGSLRRTLVHMIDVVAGWHAGLAGHNYSQLAESLSVLSLTDQHAKIHEAFAAFVLSAASADTWTATRGKRTVTAPRDVFACHVLTHGMHHRAQALNMLRHLGVATQPQSSVMQWMLATEPGQMQIVE